ncbi:unnamed protein product, partial [Heterosigma akashiwo]
RGVQLRGLPERARHRGPAAGRDQGHPRAEPQGVQLEDQPGGAAQAAPQHGVQLQEEQLPEEVLRV